MKRALSAIVCLSFGAIAYFGLPSTADAQIRIGGGRGIGVGTPYYGRPYGGYYGGAYGGYGSGYYGPGLYAPGVGVMGGYPGYYGTGARYGTGYYNQPGVVAGTMAPSTYQSNYPPQQNPGVATAIPNQPASDGRGRIMVIVPPNAQVTWNGTSSALTGDIRRYATLPLAPEGATQKFEARWTGPNGQTVSQTREVRVMPNTSVTVDFTRPETNEKLPANN